METGNTVEGSGLQVSRTYTGTRHQLRHRDESASPTGGRNLSNVAVEPGQQTCHGMGARFTYTETQKSHNPSPKPQKALPTRNMGR